MKKSMFKVCVWFLLVGMVLCTVTGCSKDTTIVEQRVQDFVVKCNALDIDGILRCLDPAISEPVAIAIGGIELVSKLGGSPIDKYALFSEITKVLLDEQGLDAMDFFESIKVDIVEVKISGKKAAVYSNITYAIADIKFTKEGVIHMVEQADVWYVNWLEFSAIE